MASRGKTQPGDAAREFFKTLKKDKASAPVYLIYGAETFLLDLALRELIRAVLPNGINDFNFDQFYGREVVGDRVVSACETLALMGGQRLVLIKEVQHVPSTQLQPVATYLKNPSPRTTLICHGQTGNRKLSKTTKFFKEAKKAGVVQEFAPLREWEIGTFLRRQANTRRLELAPDAEDALIKAVGTDLATLDASLEKVDLFLGPGDDPQAMRTVDAATLQEVVATTRTREIWDLTDAVAQRDLRNSMLLLGLMLDQGQSGVGINMMVARHFRKLWQVKAAADKGMNKNAIAKTVGMSPFVVDRYRKAAGRFKQRELRRILALLLDTDKRLKSSRLSDHLLLERMVLAICGGGKR